MILDLNLTATVSLLELLVVLGALWGLVLAARELHDATFDLRAARHGPTEIEEILGRQAVRGAARLGVFFGFCLVAGAAQMLAPPPVAPSNVAAATVVKVLFLLMEGFFIGTFSLDRGDRRRIRLHLIHTANAPPAWDRVTERRQTPPPTPPAEGTR